MSPDIPDYRVCAEHKREIELGRGADEHVTALYKIQEWIDTEVKPEPRKEVLEGYAIGERAEREYWPTAVAEKAAKLIADRRPEEEPLTTSQAERLAELMLRSDALVDARLILEGVPEEMIGGHNRWEIVAALLVASEEADRAVMQYGREIGLR